jgi:hypothetical protein
VVGGDGADSIVTGQPSGKRQLDPVAVDATVYDNGYAHD